MAFNRVLTGVLVLMILVTLYEITNNTGALVNLGFKPEGFSLMNLLALKLFEQKDDNRPLYILLVSSNPRSGSTMVSELLSTRNESVLFFEPLWDQMKKPCFQNGTCVSDFIRNVFNCSYDMEFENWLKDKTIFFRYFHPTAETCASKKCRHEFNMGGLCQNATTRIVKVIRSRLSWLKELLGNPDLRVKIIYLTRDPRGSITSIEKIGWDATPEAKCGTLYEDMDAYSELKKLYPDQIMSVSLEILSVYQLDIIKDMYFFLYGTSDIPKETQDFIDRHMHANITSTHNMNTMKNSTAEYQTWRLRIPETTLKKVESEPVCLRVLEKMRHTVFETIENSKNLNISLWTMDYI